MIGKYVFMVCSMTVCSLAQFEGDKCTVKNTGQKGNCVQLNDCNYAKNLLKSNQKPQNCGFVRFTPVVCCPLNKTQTPGQKTEKQCEIYYPKLRVNKFVFGGKKSSAKEFPHMAILGYGDKNEIQWLCGGSLISDDFVLTAAHCIISQTYGVVKWVRLGDLNISSNTDDAQPQDFTVVSTFVHPKYHHPVHYNDIALIKLNKRIKFTEYVKPACISTWRNISSLQLIATGWGKTDFFGESSSHLMKVDLNFVNKEDCARYYAGVSTRKLGNGIDDELLICAGDSSGRDTCPGDSGGPLQYKTGLQQYYVVGITSFGKACGGSNSAGVYTRVAHFIDWIEDIVWP